MSANARRRGRAAPPVLDPRAPRRPLRATVPTGDVTLDGGRVLRYLGASPTELAGDAPCTISWWADGAMRVSASLDPTPHGPLLHVALSYPDRYPTWEEIKAVRYAFYPRTVDVAMMLPADGYYVNVHAYCMQMWQTPTAWGIS